MSLDSLKEDDAEEKEEEEEEEEYKLEGEEYAEEGKGIFWRIFPVLFSGNREKMTVVASSRRYFFFLRLFLAS